MVTGAETVDGTEDGGQTQVDRDDDLGVNDSGVAAMKAGGMVAERKAR